jgi:hypothetical protein
MVPLTSENVPAWFVDCGLAAIVGDMLPPRDPNDDDDEDEEDEDEDEDEEEEPAVIQEPDE